MKKFNKKIIIKLNELILRSYPVSFEDMTDEHWAIVKKIRKELWLWKNY